MSISARIKPRAFLFYRTIIKLFEKKQFNKIEFNKKAIDKKG